jgi:four helix bundle protein
MRNFSESNIWLKGTEIVNDDYTVLPKFPDYKGFGLLTQLSQTAVTMPSNIAEGSVKSGNRDMERELEFSLGASYELETHHVLTCELHGIETDFVVNKIREEQKVQSSFMNKLQPFPLYLST